MRRYTMIVSETTEDDIGLSAHERHELILADDERLLAVAFIFEGKEPQVMEVPSS